MRVYGLMQWSAHIVACQAKTDEMDDCNRLLEAIDLQPSNHLRKLSKFGENLPYSFLPYRVLHHRFLTCTYKLFLSFFKLAPNHFPQN